MCKWKKLRTQVLKYIYFLKIKILHYFQKLDMKKSVYEKEEILIDLEKNEKLKEKNHSDKIEDFIKIKELGKRSFEKYY